MGAVTFEIVRFVSTRPVVVTRVRRAIINILCAVRAGPAGGTDTLVPVDAVDTGAVILARRRRAVVDIVMAVSSMVSRLASTAKIPVGKSPANSMAAADVGRYPADFIQWFARSHWDATSVDHFTYTIRTFRLFPAAVFSFKHWWAAAEVITLEIKALTPILAGVWTAHINHVLTKGPIVSSRAFTYEPVQDVTACGPILAGVTLAFIYFLLTMVACISWSTSALVCVY